MCSGMMTEIYAFEAMLAKLLEELKTTNITISNSVSSFSSSGSSKLHKVLNLYNYFQYFLRVIIIFINASDTKFNLFSDVLDDHREREGGRPEDLASEFAVAGVAHELGVRLLLVRHPRRPSGHKALLVGADSHAERSDNGHALATMETQQESSTTACISSIANVTSTRRHQSQIVGP